MYIQLWFFFPKKETVCLSPVNKWKCKCFQLSGIKYLQRFLAGDGMELYVVFYPLSKLLHEESEDLLKPSRCINVQICCPAAHSHGRKEPEEAKKMVSVQVGNEYVVYFGKRYTKLTHLHLSPLTAVYKEQALTNRKDVSAWVSICSGEGRSRPHCQK